MAKAKTAEEKRHMNRVKQMPCIVCGSFPVDVHHALTGGGGRKNHMKVLPLCQAHHTGIMGLHTLSRRVWCKLFGDEVTLLEKVERNLGNA